MKQTRELLEIKTVPAVEAGVSRQGCGLGQTPTFRTDLTP